MKSWFGALLMLIIGSGMVQAAATHEARLTIPGYVRLNVTGSATILVTSEDFIEALNEKEFNSDVKLELKSNLPCTVQVSGADFASGFPINYIQAKLTSEGGAYVPLNQTGQKLIAFSEKQRNTVYNVSYKLTNIPQLAQLDYDTYSTTINYTAVTNP